MQPLIAQKACLRVGSPPLHGSRSLVLATTAKNKRGTRKPATAAKRKRKEQAKLSLKLLARRDPQLPGRAAATAASASGSCSSSEPEASDDSAPPAASVPAERNQPAASVPAERNQSAASASATGNAASSSGSYSSSGPEASDAPSPPTSPSEPRLRRRRQSAAQEELDEFSDEWFTKCKEPGLLERALRTVKEEDYQENEHLQVVRIAAEDNDTTSLLEARGVPNAQEVAQSATEIRKMLLQRDFAEETQLMYVTGAARAT
jgi:hypothetical protein